MSQISNIFNFRKYKFYIKYLKFKINMIFMNKYYFIFYKQILLEK